MIGRDKAKGAPLGKSRELADPDYASDPKGERIPLDAHIRLARPRNPQTEGSRILRRPYNYSRGYDEADQLEPQLQREHVERERRVDVRRRSGRRDVALGNRGR